MSKLVTIFGGSGFVGRYIAQRLAKEGWRIRIACRRPNEALFIKPYGVVGQIEPVLCNVRDSASVRAALAGADAAINCVGILLNDGPNRFATTHVTGAANIARAAADLGVSQLVHISALGASETSPSEYARTKAAGEAAVMAAFPTATILRPSVIFGPEDLFFNKFGAISCYGPCLAIAGSETRFQPVYVDDVAKAAVMAVHGNAQGVYELGGPLVAPLRVLMEKMLQIVNRPKPVRNMPGIVAWPVAFAADMVQKLTGGLVMNTLVTRDQLRLLQSDSIVDPNAKGLDTLGITPVPMSAILPDYLWRFRPSGQFDSIHESAKHLRKTS